MFAHYGIIFAEGHFFCGVTRIFLSDIKKASVSCAEQFDFNSGWLCHEPFLLNSNRDWYRVQCPKQFAATDALPGQSQEGTELCGAFMVY